MILCVICCARVLKTKKISGSGKQKAKFDKYTVKREAPREEAAEAMQDESSTIPSFKKRKY